MDVDGSFWIDAQRSFPIRFFPHRESDAFENAGELFNSVVVRLGSAVKRVAGYTFDWSGGH